MGTIARFLSISAVACLAACGGGGGSDPEPVPFECTTTRDYRAKLVPDGAQFTSEVVAHQSTAVLSAQGFDHLVPWLTVVNAESCINHGDLASVFVTKFEVIERTSDGVERVIRRMDTSGTYWFEGETYLRTPKWYAGSVPSQPGAMYPFQGGYISDVMRMSPYIWHQWAKPRIAVNPSSRYFIVATMIITGAARVQIGYDFWKGADSPDAGYGVNNIQAGVSDWYQADGTATGRLVAVQFPSQ